MKNPILKKRNRSLVPYITILLIVFLTIAYVSFFSASARTHYLPNTEAQRDNLMWQAPPERMEKVWESDEEYTKILSPPGTFIAATENKVERIDSERFESVWSYKRDDATICDITSTEGNIAVLYNPGRGCTDVTLLDGATGQYVAQAQYSTDSELGALVYGRDRLAVVTPASARIVRASDLIPVSTFGDVPGGVYQTDQTVTGCNINDVVIGPESYAVSAQCDGDETYKIRILDIDPEESTQGNVIQTIDTNTKDHVTLPAISSSMIFFVTTGASTTDPMAYVWQLDKDYAEVASWRLAPESYGYTYQDLPMFGYTWRVGEWVRYRQGSEDLSQGVDIVGATGDPMQADDRLLIPSYDGIKVVRFNHEGERLIPIEGFPVSQYYAFSGRTVFALESEHEGHSHGGGHIVAFR